MSATGLKMQSDHMVQLKQSTETGGGMGTETTAGSGFSRIVNVLAVDDEEMNLEILMKHLNKAHFHTTPVSSGEAAWDYLTAHPGKVDVVVLDKMMPGMSGIDLLKKIKADPAMRNVMVILQTASVGTAEMVEGIQAGAYYYVTKPYAAELLLSIVHSAARDFLEMEQLREQMTHNARILEVTEICHFSIRTPEDAHMLALHLASFFKETLAICTGLSALMENAIEHGNLGIGIDNKRQWMTDGTWDKEFTARLNTPENTNKKVMVSFQKLPEAARILISDEGKGFQASSFQQLDPSRLTSPNGRGIAIASLSREYTIEYLGDGSKVCMTIPIAGSHSGGETSRQNLN